jgi:hypothetical protein
MLPLECWKPKINAFSYFDTTRFKIPSLLTGDLLQSLVAARFKKIILKAQPVGGDMTIYITYCSAKKTKVRNPVKPDKLYDSRRIRSFMRRFLGQFCPIFMVFRFLP